ncbi:prepilin-type N-terminal cleavage/methylation domain-containing protein [Lentisphaera profundi]|uniref:Prepilin-type N-terminal cleavage/methylation domain-containing protein n=1 Tax=Lentisphaera profundi TaxID=1658616 RepID=A0ABY7W1J9_9BACT|nr:prepilin-type N-terminal cleavage/methylation domain-containing protein [Lentisphaera profundi]WDE99353.1 prepilin-type N-terminal cleavage/methylation domain-containing protein [Lentisphaera profundi]
MKLTKPSQTLSKFKIKYRFTLIELLVVIAIIGILASLLLPSLGRARKNAKRAACINNMKQLGISTYLYTDDNEGKFPWRSPTIRVTYDDSLAGYDSRETLSWAEKTVNGFTEAEIGKSAQMYVCPSTPFSTEPQRSYQINIRGNAGQKGFRGVSGDLIDSSIISEIVNPTRVIAYSGGGGNGIMGASGDGTMAYFQQNSFYTSLSYGGEEPHESKTNYLMADGHAVSMRSFSTLITAGGTIVDVSGSGNDTAGTYWDAGDK